MFKQESQSEASITRTHTRRKEKIMWITQANVNDFNYTFVKRFLDTDFSNYFHENLFNKNKEEKTPYGKCVCVCVINDECGWCECGGEQNVTHTKC